MFELDADAGDAEAVNERQHEGQRRVIERGDENAEPWLEVMFLFGPAETDIHE